jgi:hypothetical protein
MVLAASFRSEYRHMAKGVQVGDSEDRKRSVMCKTRHQARAKSVKLHDIDNLHDVQKFFITTIPTLIAKCKHGTG